MAQATTVVELPLDGSWLAVESAIAECWVQLISDGPVIAVVAGTTAPATTALGLVFDRDGLTMFPFEALTSTERVYLRARPGQLERVVLLGDIV